MSAVVLRLFTGPHMGAELVLEPGDYLLGSGFDCDLILQDSSVAPQHLRLTVDDQAASVRVLALEGQALVQGAPLAAGAELPPRTPCFVGLTCLAWAPTAIDSPTTTDLPDLREAWDEVGLALTAVLHPTTAPTGRAAPAASGEAGEAGGDNAKAADAAAESPGTSSDAAPGTGAAGAEAPDAEAQNAAAQDATGGADRGSTANNILTLDRHVANDVGGQRFAALAAQQAKARRNRRVGLLLLLLLLLGGLVFKTRDELNRPLQSVEDIKTVLAEAGFPMLSVAEGAKGPVITGRLPDDQARGRLVRLVQRMHLPVYLNVQVDGDMVQALLMAFNSRELFPKVWSERHGETMNLHVAGYMKDGVVEAWALAGVREDLPWFGTFLQQEGASASGKLVRSILHAEGVEPVLRPALEAAGLGAAKIVYLPGAVEISGVFDVETRRRLDRVLDEVLGRLGVPVVFQIREGLPEMSQAVGGKSTGMHPDTVSRPQASAGPGPTAAPKSPAAFRVTGVTMSPMRFITLESGERVFEGGLLPGGYTLESISQSRLELRRDGHVTTLTLRGSDDQ